MTTLLFGCLQVILIKKKYLWFRLIDLYKAADNVSLKRISVRASRALNTRTSIAIQIGSRYKYNTQINTKIYNK